MANIKRIGSTLTAIGLVGALAACSTTGQRTAMSGTTLFGKKVDGANIGLATRAQLALSQNDVSGAIELAERAVANSPTDAGFRGLLGNCYLAAGRFASAEAAFSDSLGILPNQPQVALKLALAQIALGRSETAVAVLYDAQGGLDASDVGLALALAGRHDQSVEVLETAARGAGADARTRQNLALAHALAGNWDAARAVAAQDLAASAVDERLQQWMTFAKPGLAGSQVAAFIGVTPAAADPGQPLRLALNKDAARARMAMAVVAPVAPAPVAVAPASVPVVAYAPAPEPIAAPVVAYVPAPVVARVAAPAPVIAPAPVVAQAPVYAPAPIAVAEATPILAAPVAPRAPVAAAVAPIAKPAKVAIAKTVKPVALRAPRPALSVAATRLNQPVAELRRASLSVGSGRSPAVVQLGAYSSRASISSAWNKVSGRHAALRSYQPVTARFDAARGTVYRLSVKGFTSDREAIQLCQSIKRSGGTCFVRATSGDAPVRFASR